jgi:hypothetical protein
MHLPTSACGQKGTFANTRITLGREAGLVSAVCFSCLPFHNRTAPTFGGFGRNEVESHGAFSDAALGIAAGEYALRLSIDRADLVW